MTEFAGVTALRGKQRPWQEKWRETEQAHKAVTDVVYSGAPSGHRIEERTTIALVFFRVCHELPEAIEGDGSVPITIKHRARRLAVRRAVLILVDDLDNTRKHGRRDPGKCHARVGEISWTNGTPPKMTILRECPNRAVQLFDLLTAATDATSAWRSFFTRNGIAP
jgi:hypothetical protein